jgi:hypothetical protein
VRAAGLGRCFEFPRIDVPLASVPRPSNGSTEEAEESVGNGEHAADGEDSREGDQRNPCQPEDQGPKQDHGVNDLRR